jgi:hypothetical protein
MAMTKRDYEAVAKAIREERLNWVGNGQVQLALNYLAGTLANGFADGNERFDRQKFKEAARVEWDDVTLADHPTPVEAK